uniref:Ribosomal RNA-processing protein 44 n=1 Tax=Mucochytrium quahogii TaxID=96639 RepID=A0A7S2W718_9STRA|mmetsp:Transcript_44945/g.71787  ORF Transcript_44945/g.71787 Transcript_44945/m.71787 type:complete len:853 (-) Transcript_44945:2096-4654(-)
MGGEQDERKMYYRKTRKGKVFNVVRERYLRDDVGLGTLVGQAMIRDEAQLAGVLGEEHMLESGVREILVLDTNVVLKQIDVLEKDDCAPFHNVVLCDTVLGEVKKINLGIYNRVLLLLRDDKRCFIAFPNENHRDTWSVQRKGESPNDYNDRLIRDVTKWYRNQVEPAGIAKVKLLTNDRKCKELAIKEGLSAETIHAFVDSISSKYPELSDLLAQPTEDYDQREQAAGSRVAKFAAHLSEPEITRRLQAGTVTQGTFRVSPYNRKEGSIMVYSRDGTGKKILIRGFASMNRAMEGDRVAVSLVSRKEANLAAKVTSGEADDNEVPEATDGLLDVEAVDPESATLVGTKAPTVVDTPSGYGVVVGIIKRAWREYCASVDELDATREVQSENVLVVPVDQKIPKIRIRTRQLDAIKDKRILVSIDSWDRYSNFPDGHFIRTLGVIGDRETETAVLLHEHDIPTRAFSKKVMKCLPREGADWTVTEENSKGRVDLRHLPICSIDPPGCKDIDDALHFRMLENGNIEVGVHIADVTHFVRAGTPIDQEAANRGTSTYLVERRLDMLPGLLTTDICSLRGEVERFAFSVIWEFTPPVMDESRDRAGVGSKKQKTDGSKMSDGENNDGRGLRQVNVRFCKSIIKSKAAMSYGEAQVFLDDPTAMGELPNSVRMLNKVAKVLRQRRIDAGALTLASPEVRFKLDNDSHDPTDVEMYQHKETNALVEEFMLLANITVAKRIVERFPRCSMLRRHPKPDKEMFQELLKATRIAGVELQVDTSKELADSLDLATKPGVPFFQQTDPYFDDPMHDASGVLHFWRIQPIRVWTLRTCVINIYSFYIANSSICRCYCSSSSRCC